MAADASAGGPRLCRADETDRIGAVINAAAQAYRGVMPADCWHDPYMSIPALQADIDAGVRFWCTDAGGALIAVMGIQSVADATLIRHAYVLPGWQNAGVGRALLARLMLLHPGRLLVGVWAAAGWAVAFYMRHGFVVVDRQQATALLGRYWTVSARQVESSVVLARDLLQDPRPA